MSDAPHLLPTARTLPWVLLLPLLAACGSGGGSTAPTDPGSGSPGPVCTAGTGPAMQVSGTVTYERLVLTPAGLGPGLVTRPARWVDVQVHLVAGGTCIGTTSTDETGTYSLTVNPDVGEQLEVVAFSRTEQDGLRNATVHDGLAPAANVHVLSDVFRQASAPFLAGGAATADVLVPYNAGGMERPSIGFGLLDTVLTCSESIRVATGVVPPLCHVYTAIGNNGLVGGTFYSNGNKAITVLGGMAGLPDATDTDYFDDPVVAHEYGHFVEFNLSHSLTRGGNHSGENLEPPMAWSEGQATGFGCLALRAPAYIDSVGTSGGTQINTTVEDWPQAVRGIGSEETVLELVWDLGDGQPGIPDADADTAAVPLGALYDALFSFSPSADGPYLGLLLDRLVAASAIPQSGVQALLAAPENQQVTYPLVGADVWPAPLAVPGMASGSLTSMVANPCRAYTASRWYGFTLAAPATLSFSLAITPIGMGNDNLDLVLLRIDGAQLARSDNAGATPESIGPVALAAGTYVVRVEAGCVGAGNDAAYTLTVTN